MKRMLAADGVGDEQPKDEVQVSADLASEFGKLVAGHDKDKGAASAQKQAQDAKTASYQIIRAWDHQLRLFGTGLHLFRPLSARPTMLQENEVRWVADMEPWDSYEVPEGTPWRRVCRIDTETQERRFEIPDKFLVGGPPVLAISADECGCNLAPFSFLTGALGLRLVLLRDQAHRCWRDFRLALGEAQLWPDVIEQIHAMNVRHGPWASQAWFNATREAVKQHLSRSSSADPLFEVLWPRIAADSPSVVAEPGSAEERAALWEQMKELRNLHTKGARTTTTRWFEFVKNYEEFERHYHSHLFCYCLVLWHTGVVKSILGLPVWDIEGAPCEVAATPVVKQGGQETPMNVEKREQSLAELRTKAHNAIHLAAIVMGQPGAYRRGRIVSEVGRIIDEAFRRELAGCSDPHDTFKYHLGHAMFGYSIVLRRVFGTLTNMSALQNMRFAFDPHKGDHYAKLRSRRTTSSSSKDQSPEFFARAFESHEEHVDEQAFAKLLWNLCCYTTKHRALTVGHFLYLPLGQMALLLHPEDTWVKRGLELQKTNWEVLMEAERRQHTTPGVKAILHSISFMFQDVVRELMVLLAQHGHAFVCPPARSMLETIYKGFMHTVIVEKGFQRLQDMSREQKNSRSARCRRWHELATASLMRDMGRQQIEGHEGGMPADLPRHIGGEMFEAMALNPSIPDKELLRIKGRGKTDYPSPSAQQLQVQPAAWQLLVAVHAGSLWHKVSCAYLALLCTECSVVRSAPGRCWLVLKSCEFGILVWPAEQVEATGLVFFRPSRQSGIKATWLPVLDTDGWQAIPCEVVSPAVVASWVNPGELALGVYLLQTLPAEKLEVAAARTGFKQCHSAHLDKLLRRAGMGELLKGKDAVKGVLPKVEALCKAFLPGIGAAELGRIIRARAGLGTKVVPSVMMQGANLQTAEGCIDSGDLQEARHFRDNAYKSEVTVKACALNYMADKGYICKESLRPELVAVGARAPPPVPRAPTTAPMKVQWTWSEQFLKTKIPEIAGSSIQHVQNKWNSCWTARYPGVSPGSRTNTYGGAKRGLTSEAAAKDCMLWIWAQHRAKTGEACPFDLEAACGASHAGAGPE